MGFSEIVKARYSVRAYKPQVVEGGKLQEVLEAACLAPTAANRQAFGLVVIHTAGREAELRRIYDRPWFVQAPLLICACGIPGQAWVRSDGRSYCDVDVAIAMDHLVLAAADLGLGTCWVAAFNVEEARKILGLPEDVEPIIFTPLGYPDGEPRPRRRKPLEELVRYEHW